ncbi:Dehydration-responsive protein RD22 precursor, putative [Ricinus communis]|uniref:Dehydration-responsive protein RD22, putative n=1 Tax=Ricinus communis TaxID=3988 RepID=B9T8G6_RICCO|nr:Dehydration-responsive protein RD22 precursor, putative [Ricinus communis]
MEDMDNAKSKYGKHYDIEGLDDVSNLHVGQKMKIYIPKPTNKAKFMPRQVAESMPFSSEKLPVILERFSVKRESLQAKKIKETIENYESTGIKGEDKYCPTSLESLIDFIVSHIDRQATSMQEYTTMGVKMLGENQVVCHKQKYPYAVYYCHSINATKVYAVALGGADGTKAKALAVCHLDTSSWNPRYLAFLMLKIKPGEGTICHFIKSNTLVWSSN